MYDLPFFTSDPQSNQRTLLFFRVQNTQMWLRMTLHIPYKDANDAAEIRQFIPFENAVTVNLEELPLYICAPFAPNGSLLMEHIEQQVNKLGMVWIHGIHGMHGMHPDAEKCWIEVVAEVYRRFGERLPS